MGFYFWPTPSCFQPVKKLSFVKEIGVVTKFMPDDETPIPRIASGFDSPARSDILKLKPQQRLLQKLSGSVSGRVNGSRSRDLEGNGGDGVSCYVSAALAKRLIILELFVSNSVESESNYGGVSVILKEMVGVEGVKTIAWVGDSIIIGKSEGYVIISVSSGRMTMMFSLPESSGPPKLGPLWRSKNVLLLVDNVGVVVNAAGQPVGGSFVFRDVPDSTAEMSAYVVVAKDGKLDLYRRQTGAYVQTVSVAKSNTGMCIVASDELGASEKDVVVLATPYKVTCFCKVSAEEQIKDMLRKKNFNEAGALLEEAETEGELTKGMISFVHAQMGFMLLFDLHFEEAVDHFLLSEDMQPSEIFPFIMRDPNRWSYLVPRNRYWGLHPPPVPLEQVVDDGLTAIQRALFLRKAGVETAIDENFLLNPPSRANLLEKAVDNIIRYLRASRYKDLSLSVLEGVDTLLMYLYRTLNRIQDMEELASSENSCIVKGCCQMAAMNDDPQLAWAVQEELETLLDDSGHLPTLAFLYASKGMQSKALAIWRVLSRNYSTGFWRDPSASSSVESLDKNEDVISRQRAAAVEASKLLQESSDQDLVLEHLGWIADVDDELAVVILTSNKRAIQLSPEEVLAAIDSKKVDVLQRYLQWLIEDQDCDDTRFHTLYALSLAQSALEAYEVNWKSEHADATGINHVHASIIHNIKVDEHREKLQQFLEDSDLYDPEEVLYVIEGSELWLEKAILYKKMGHESQALQILALKLEDSEAAEQYCAEIGRNDAYMQLLDMYLNPHGGKPPMFKAAVRLLHNHGETLDPLQVLEKLSPSMPLQLASDTILRMLRARVHHHRQGQIVHKVSQAISLDSRMARLEERMRYVQIHDESICDSCHSRLGTKLFAMYPDDSVVCYKCYRHLGVSTSARGRNFKQDPIFKPGWLVNR